MAQTLDQINALRSFRNEEPLTELPAEQQSNPELKDDKAPLIEDGKKEDVDLGKDKTSEENKEAEKTPITNDLTEDAVKAFLKAQGIEVNSISDLKPKEIVETDPAKLKEKKEADKLTFALTKGLITKTEYDNFTRDSADPKQLVYAEFYAEAKAADPELTDEDIQADFMDSYNLSAAPDTAKFKAAVKSIAALGQAKLKEKYGKVYEIDTAFDTHESDIKSKADYNRNLLEQTPVYKSAVDKVFKELPKLSVPFSDQEVYEAEYPAEMLEEVKGLMLKAETAEDQINKGFDEKGIKDAVEMILLKKSFAAQVKNIAEQYLLKNQKGVHGIPESGSKLPTDTDPFPNMTADQKKAMSYFKGEVPVGSN